MVICFTQPIQRVSDRLHSAVPALRSRPHLPMLLTLGRYNIRDGHALGLPQAIRAVNLGYYDLLMRIQCTAATAWCTMLYTLRKQ